MAKRISFVVLAVFWATMNVLLWRAEFGGNTDLGASVPVELVWEKMLTAPDASPLEIIYQGQNIGYCRWLPNVGEAGAPNRLADDQWPPEGMIKQVTGYTVDFEGSVKTGDSSPRVRFNTHIGFSTNRLWLDFWLQVITRPAVFELQTAAGQERLHVRVQDGQTKWERSLTREHVRDPSALMRELGLPVPPLLLAPLAPIVEQTDRISSGLTWQARHDWLRFGHSHLRVYRLSARLVDKYEVVIFLSRVGEILRVELPQQIVLVSDALIKI